VDWLLSLLLLSYKGFINLREIILAYEQIHTRFVWQAQESGLIMRSTITAKVDEYNF
jgi:hypothetical protein